VWVQQEDYQVVGQALAEARERAGLTQKQLAHRLRKPQSFVSNFERGQRRIDILELLRIADILEAEPHAIFADILARFKRGRTRKRLR
jgi:transcriptional regulator with XRE-family HTH domain